MCFWPENRILTSSLMKFLHRAPEIDISELESLFSATVASSGIGGEKGGIRRGTNAHKPEIVQLVTDIFFH